MRYNNYIKMKYTNSTNSFTLEVDANDEGFARLEKEILQLKHQWFHEYYYPIQWCEYELWQEKRNGEKSETLQVDV